MVSFEVCVLRKEEKDLSVDRGPLAVLYGFIFLYITARVPGITGTKATTF